MASCGLNIGSFGTGSLTIANGGTVINNTAFTANIGPGPSSLGTVVVTGAGSTWTNSSDVVVGGLGTGTLTVENGGTVNSGGGSVGSFGSGTVTVTGLGSTWNVGPTGGFDVGRGGTGTGTLVIANGGKVINTTPANANIGSFAGSQGTVTVTGAGSTWSNSLGSTSAIWAPAPSRLRTAALSTGGLLIATNAGAVGTLNIGAGAAPGTLTAPSVAFGAGTGTINFNHTSATTCLRPRSAATAPSMCSPARLSSQLPTPIRAGPRSRAALSSSAMAERAARSPAMSLTTASSPSIDRMPSALAG